MRIGFAVLFPHTLLSQSVRRLAKTTIPFHSSYNNEILPPIQFPLHNTVFLARFLYKELRLPKITLQAIQFPPRKTHLYQFFLSHSSHSPVIARPSSASIRYERYCQSSPPFPSIAVKDHAGTSHACSGFLYALI